MPAHLTKPLGLGVLLLAVILLVSGPAHAVPVTINLCAKAGSITLPDSAVVPIWGFVTKNPAFSCDNNSVHVAQLPGPVIRVTVGDVVTLRVHNRLSVPISILIPGQKVTPLTDTTPGTFTNEVAPLTIGRYRFTAKTGTYIYESGTDPDRQVAMGLHGALIVASGVLNQAYAQVSSSFDTEAVLVLGEIDPALHANPSGFNMQEYKPIYRLINGQAYPDTPPILASAGQNVLLRYLNPSFTHHAMALLGLHKRVIAREAFELPTVISAVAETIPAGTTADMITTVPAGPATFPLYNRNMQLTNGSANTPGGMQTQLTVGP